MIKYIAIISFLSVPLLDARAVCPLTGSASQDSNGGRATRGTIEDRVRSHLYVSEEKGRFAVWDQHPESIVAPVEFIGADSKIGTFPFLSFHRRAFPASNLPDLIWIPDRRGQKPVPHAIPGIRELDYNVKSNNAAWIGPSTVLALVSKGSDSFGEVKSYQDSWVVIETSSGKPVVSVLATPWNKSWSAPALIVDTNSRNVQDPDLIEVKRNEISLTPVFFYSKERRRVYVLVGQPNNQRHFFWELFEIDPNDLTHALSHERLDRTRSFLSADRQGRVTRWREPTRVDFLPGHSISLQWRITDEKGHFVVQGSDFDF